MLKIAILGAAGRMGRALIACATRSADCRVAAAVESEQCPLLGQDAGLVAGAGDLGVPLTADAHRAAQAAAVLLDFSFPSSAVRHAELAAEFHKPLVIGTTGLPESATAALRAAATQTAVVWSPNMSLGVNLLFALVEQVARRLSGYDVEIVETHHRHKQDAPSGTALRLAEAAARARGAAWQDVICHGRRGPGARPANQIGVHAVRAGDVVGDHTVVFAGGAERLELTHRAGSRDCLALGALRAAQWVARRPPGLYTMLDVLEINA